MKLEKAHEPLEGEVKFPHIDIPLTRDELIELRQYILVSSEAFDEQSIRQQLEIDFNPSPINKLVGVCMAENKVIDPYKVAIALEQENFKSNTSLHFFDVLEAAYNVDEQVQAIFESDDEGCKKFALDLHKLFSHAPIMTALQTELARLEQASEDKENRNNPILINEINLDIRSFTRAVMIQQAVLVAINYN